MKTGVNLVLGLAFLFFMSGCVTDKEHAGDGAEHGGEGAEHAGQDAEHGGNEAEHGGKKAKKKKKKKKKWKGKKKRSKKGAAVEMETKYYAEDIKEAMLKHIDSLTVGGVFRIKDDKTGERLDLEFVKIHDPVRVIEGRGYFACTDFHPVGAEAGKLYDLDFWLNPNAEGELVVTETRVHKDPEFTDAGWTKSARYTFRNDVPVEIRR